MAEKVTGTRQRGICIIVNGPSSAGKSTLCAALQDMLVELAQDQGQSFAKVAFDDFLGTLSTRYYPHSFTKLIGGDIDRLASKSPHDGKAGWEYVDESEAEGHPNEDWTRLAFSPESDRLLVGQYRGWGCHLELGTNLIVDAFLQDKLWAEELLAVVKRSGARMLLVGVHCADEELKRRELQRGDRPRGLGRRSSVACHSHGLKYVVEVHTDQQSTEQSVAAIVMALQALQEANAPCSSTSIIPAPPQPSPLTHRSGTELIGLLRAGQVSSAELLEAFLARVEEVNPVVNAVVVFDTVRARARAAEMDERRARGETLGPLHGLPMTIKNHPQAALPLDHDSELLVTQLLAAGAVIFGYTNVPLDASDVQTYNAAYGTTNNPWDLKRTPGGSSGGSSAALAAALTPVEVGSDIGGSIRVPASHCGVFGHKCTYRVVPGRGTHGTHTSRALGPERDLSVRGPMARTADDLALLMDVIVSPPPLEAGYWALNLPKPTKQTLAEYKIAVWDEQPGFPVCAEVRAIVKKVTAALQNGGADVHTGARPDFDGAESHRLYLQLLGCTNTAKEAWKVGQAWEQQHNSNLEARGNLAAVEGHLWEIPDNDFVVEHSVTQSFRQFYAANERRNALRIKWAKFFRERHFDAVLMPVYPLPAIEHDQAHEDKLYPHTLYGPYWRPSGRTLTIDGIVTAYQDAVFWSGIATVSYLPSTVFPAGFGEQTGLPIGLQLVGPEGGDYLTIALASLLEKEAGFCTTLPTDLFKSKKRKMQV